MSLVSEISTQVCFRANDVMRPLIIHARNKMSPNLTFYAQLEPIYMPFPHTYLPPNVRLTR
jgi:hypothetical protein